MTARAKTLNNRSGITCPHYQPLLGGKKCRDYLGKGECTRPDVPLCSEWLRCNRQLLFPGMPKLTVEECQQLIASSPVDMFGQPLPGKRIADFGKPSLPPRAPSVPQAAPDSLRESSAAGEMAPATPRRELTPEDIAAFRAARIEACLHSDNYGDVWLVPKRTGQDRMELTPEQAVKIISVATTFPGSQITAFNKPAAGEGAGA